LPKRARRTRSFDLLLTGKMGTLTDEQQQALQSTQSALQRTFATGYG
jgi:hypothetical protein